MLRKGLLTALLSAFLISGCAFTTAETTRTVQIDGRLWKAELVSTESSDGTVGGFRLQQTYNVNGRLTTVSSGFHDSQEEAYEAFANGIRDLLAKLPEDRRQLFIERASNSAIVRPASSSETFGD